MLSDYQSYYVYEHFDPNTKEVVYIGHGKGQRAWMYETNFSRSPEHSTYLRELADRGYLPPDWTRIVVSGVSKEEARSRETDRILLVSPKYNKLHNKAHQLQKATATFGEELCETVFALHLEGFGYQRIAYLCGADVPKNKVMSIKRILLHAKAIH